ncbi:hypothetical protein FSZ31_09525 [Sphingorhabdus soli]|uniref:Peptidase A2 domain-containing protein n=1 Tax=Flavisphingopyxis soli TaxID=2601267 RepID=A0A5C6U8H3_9SPHN|nr:retroviral-like aspartic protease family protein [Sphingorhabdus soli]TXC69152.1 hypothetical protein FSZ31_09525 [Sphingorhabdus soli]
MKLHLLFAGPSATAPNVGTARNKVGRPLALARTGFSGTRTSRIAVEHGGNVDWLHSLTACVGYGWMKIYNFFHHRGGDRDAERHILCKRVRIPCRLYGEQRSGDFAELRCRECRPTPMTRRRMRRSISSSAARKQERNNMQNRTFLAAVVAAAMATAVAAEIPLSFSGSGHVVVPVRINGGDQHLFVFDTGAEGSAVYSRFSSEAKLESAGREEVVGQTGAASLPLRRIARLEVDGRTFGPVVASELPDRPDGAVMAGIIGLDIMGRYLVDFDLSAARLSLLDGVEAEQLIASQGEPVSARILTGGLLAVPVKVNGVAGWGIIDTGARESRINTKFANLAKVKNDDARAAIMVQGATNTSSSLRPGRTRTIRLLGQELSDAPIRIADLPVFDAFGLGDEPAMIIGADYLGHYRLLIDFPTRRVWWQ